MKKYAIIVAGGSGTRMGADIPKQFIEIYQKPILVHTIHRFLEAVPEIEIVLVVPSKWKEYTEDILEKHINQVHERINIALGGETRFESVKNGVKSLKNEVDGYVAIHDSVRCCIKPSDIQKAFELSEEKGNCVICTTLKESIRKKNGQITQSVPRNEYLIVQTPQIFHLKDLQNVYLQHKESEPNILTDDASLMEKYGYTIYTHLIGDYNIKITTPQDLVLARYLLDTI